MRTRVWAMLYAIGLVLTIAVSQAGAVPSSDELRILLSDGTRLFSGTLDEGQERDPRASITTQQLVPFRVQGCCPLFFNIVLTDPEGISDVIQFSFFETSPLVTFPVQITMFSDPETPFPGQSLVKAEIPEAGDANHPLDAEGFLNVTNDVFAGLLPGGVGAPLIILVKSDTNAAVPSPTALTLLGIGLIAGLIARTRSRTAQRREAASTFLWQRLWHWLLGRPASESGRFRHGDRGQGPGDRRRMALMSTILRYCTRRTHNNCVDNSSGGAAEPDPTGLSRE